VFLWLKNIGLKNKNNGIKFSFKRYQNRSGMMNKNKRTMNLNGRMNYKFKTMNMQF